jgi:hypothetical protein
MPSNQGISTSDRSTASLSLERLVVNPDDNFVFDFDGVISSRFEDDIFKLPADTNEIELIADAAQYFGINCAGMDQRYQRHLIYQAAAWTAGRPIEPGPGLLKAAEAARQARLFVLTARSGWYAVERLRLFFTEQQIVPVEIYNVGRVKKDRQIELICRELWPKPVYFIEDSDVHLADAAKIPVNNLFLIKVDAAQPYEGSALRRHFTEVVERVISRPKPARRFSK